MKLLTLRWLTTFLFVSFVIPVFAQFKLTDPIPVDPNVKVGKLPNGLTYYIQKNPKPEKKLELRLVVNTGSVLEDADQRGLAHFMEHMSFNGSKNFPKNELVDYLQKTGVEFGADLNAYTSFDETVYILPIPSDKPETVEKGFTVLEDWAFNNLMDKSEIEKERGVVLEESRLSKGANERMSRKYYPHLFNGSKYAIRLPIGNDTILRTFKPETLNRFYKQWYRPNLMAVVVVGDIDPVAAEKKIKAHFSKFTNPANAKPRPSIIPIAVRTKPEAMVLTDEEATNTVLRVYNYVKPAEKVKTWAAYREQVIEELVTSLINQRLQELTQQENPPFMYGYTGFTSFLRGYDAFVSYAVIGNSPAQNAVDALVAETERARQYGFLASELDRAKAVMLNGAEMAYRERNKSESGELVWRYVSHYLEGEPAPGDENNYLFIKQVLPTITLEEINTTISKMPSNKNAFALITAPAKMKDKLPSSPDLLKEMVAATAKPVKPYEEKAVAQQLIDKEPLAGKITDQSVNQKLGTIDLTLSNGITVTLKPTAYKNDQVLMDAWRWGGFHQFSLADKDNAKYAASIVSQMGVKDLSPTDLKKFLSGKTASVYPYLNNHEEGIEGSSSVKDFETFLQLTYLYFTQPRKDEGLFKSFVTKQKSSVQFLRQNPRAFYQDTLTKIIYQNNPWTEAFPTEETFDKLNLDRSLAIYNHIFSNAYGMHFTFVGNLDTIMAKPLIEKYLGSLPATPKENAYKDNNVRPVKGIVNANIKKGKEPQSIISLVFNGEADYNPKENLVFRALLEAMNIKVTEKLREEMSGIYGGGFHGGISKRPYTNYSITAYIPCGPENVEKLTAALMNLIQTAQNKGIEQKDLDKVKETWKKQYNVNIQSNDFWLSTLSNAWINRDNPEDVLSYVQNVDSLTVEDLQKAARKYFKMDNYVKAVLYPENAQVASDKMQPTKNF
ncbi:insulinase family protein [Chitinophagaceae bacterium LB-8]|uniref:Insulinase family protein n=1 Tax=Paraflavisolibacter caeni TaxID=2982496 RepID=A0A9X2XYJ8_9BACT|nr:M16 family metallopeptidase [Paraflavisolibacter caeni]MCU7551027.1 insulinase family protein [Paraflavisolibacter caeni]